MNAQQKRAAAAVRALLETAVQDTDRAEAAPSLAFTAAAARPIEGPTHGEVAAALAALEAAERANDSGPIARAVLAVVQALGV